MKLQSVQSYSPIILNRIVDKLNNAHYDYLSEINPVWNYRTVTLNRMQFNAYIFIFFILFENHLIELKFRICYSNLM